MQHKIAFVIPWHGENIAGGAEALCRGFCRALRAAGQEVEILTTCARDSLSDWNRNFHRPGLSEENGVTVRRFPLRKRDAALHDQLNRKILHGYPLSPSEEQLFFAESIRSVELEQFIASRRGELRLICLPYCYGTTHYALAAARGATLLPCLHPEGYALLAPVRRQFQEARGIIFNSEAERQLANRLFDLQQTPQLTLGAGIELEPRGRAERFREKFQQPRPFLLYIGRKDATKNVPLLCKYFQHYCESRPDAPDLLLIGPGAAALETGRPARIIDLGELGDEDKFNALAAALALVQPSVNESLGLVLLEAWREGAPVIVNAYCAAMQQLARQANGGLSFQDYFEFCACVDFILQQPDAGRQIGLQGRRHLGRSHHWPELARRLLHFLQQGTEKQADDVGTA